jgi:hypothetical protein
MPSLNAAKPLSATNKMSDKEVRADAKLKNLPDEILDTLWRFRNPEEDGEKLTLEAILVQLKDERGIEVSISTLSEFYKWLRFKRRMESAQDRAQQAREEMLKDPTINADDIERVAQAVFTAETMEDGNVKGFVALAKLRIANKQLQIDERRIELLERKAAQADQAKTVSDDDALTAEEKATRMKQIFRMG